MRPASWLLSAALALLLATSAAAERRFPPPDFEGGYKQEPLVFQQTRAGLWEYIDLGLLFLGLAAGAFLLHKKRSRTGIFILGIASLLYFGFYKKGCICPIGAIQNVFLSLMDPSHAISLAVIGVFILPLVFALYYGRVFCGGVCPLGAIQDLFLFKSINIPAWLEGPLGLLRYVYLGAAIYVVAEYNRFIICEYDPFISLFRFDGPSWKFLMAIGFLVVGLFIARPYCRFLCPYGALLSLFSRWTASGVRITPADCINCTLCDAVCPFNAIRRPQLAYKISDGMRIVFVATGILVLPLLSLAGYWILKWSVWGLFLGFWLGLVACSKIISLCYQANRTTYETDNSSCLSCGRCYKWCPYEQARIAITLPETGKPDAS